MTKFLTLEGLQHYDGKIKAIIPSKSEFEALKNTVANGMSWRNPVENLAALKAIKAPQEGWTVSLTDTNQIYRFDAQDKTPQEQSPNIIKPTDQTAGAWILLGTAVYSKATEQADGLMSTDHVKALNKATQDISGINNSINNLDASKITSGVLDIARIPKAAIERLVVVADDTARLKLTKEQAQTGDTVKVTATGKMYFVIDDTKLNQEEGYSVYTAGSASSVPWEGITGKPQDFKPSTHNQGSETIDKMNNYTKAAQASAIAPTDSLNTAIGKLEKGLDNKLNTTDVVAIQNSEIDALF